jgi:sugar/nucleoside kinase (ribokinase family)
MKKEFQPIRIAVIGTICWDKITYPEGRTVESFGGIAYSVLTLAALLESKAIIRPVCLVGDDRYEKVLELFSQSQEIDPTGIRPVEHKNNTVTLVYVDEQKREEILEGGVPSLTYEEIEPFLEADYLVVNFISGWDLSLEVMQRIREKSRAKIYMDIHSLTLGKEKSGKRFLQAPKDWEMYVTCADCLQLNQDELEALAGEQLTTEEIEREARKLHKLGPVIVAVTLADRGCLLIHKTANGDVVSKSMPAKRVEPVRDTTGCGDVFGAAFLGKLIATRDPVQAADFGNDLAGLKATFSGLEGLKYFTPLDLEFT